MTAISKILREEEEKRERNWDPLMRWKVLQQTIAWVDAQQAVPRNSRTAALRLQAEKLATLQERAHETAGSS